MGSFFLPNWSPPDDPARPLPAEGRPWPSDDDDDYNGAQSYADNPVKMKMKNLQSFCEILDTSSALPLSLYIGLNQEITIQ